MLANLINSNHGNTGWILECPRFSTCFEKATNRDVKRANFSFKIAFHPYQRFWVVSTFRFPLIRSPAPRGWIATFSHHQNSFEWGDARNFEWLTHSSISKGKIIDVKHSSESESLKFVAAGDASFVVHVFPLDETIIFSVQFLFLSKSFGKY